MGKACLGNVCIHCALECVHWISMVGARRAWRQMPVCRLVLECDVLGASRAQSLCPGGDISEASHSRWHGSQVLSHQKFFH